jgi:hypothetical protein
MIASQKKVYGMMRDGDALLVPKEWWVKGELSRPDRSRDAEPKDHGSRLDKGRI